MLSVSLLAEASVCPAEPDVSPYPVRGIDVSHHKGEIDWPAVARAGASFAYIKASEGGDLRDSRFVNNVKKATKAGLKVGAYHYFTFCRAGDLQAKNFIGAVAKLPVHLPHAIDVEYVGNCRSHRGEQEIRRQLRAFLKVVEQTLQETPLLYVTGRSHARIVKGHFDRYALWVRDLTGGSELIQQKRFQFWQYSDSAKLAGIAGKVDLNVFAGSEQEFEALLIKREER